ncbi:MAG: CDP-alcohol phosphatidyltransferase family protein [Anaerolineae bacterium]|jgi:phosphatidylglycerophosphate synthase|nr:CDP-alcohol phosphatidyltransferase family protein [Anaerolineae bacterium]
MTEHKREIPMFLGALERPALAWLAKRMPAWVTPDILTLVGFLGSVLIFASYILTNVSPWFLWLASLGFIINWFGDSLDGTLARYRQIERPKYGFFIDHTVDAIDEMLIFFSLGLSPYVHFNLAAVALVGYLLMSSLVYILTIVSGVFRIAYVRIGPTEMRGFAIIANAIIFFIGNPVYQLMQVSFTLYDGLLVGISALLYLGFIGIVIVKGREFSKEDPATYRKKRVRKQRKSAAVPEQDGVVS